MTNKQPTNKKRKKQKYIVKVDDNFHYMDESERYSAGEFDSYAKAVATCRKIVDECLESALKPGMSAEELYDSYVTFGEDPFILGGSDKGYSSWDYAKERCQELTEES